MGFLDCLTIPIFLFFEEPPFCSPQWLNQFTIPSSVQKGSLFSTSFPHLLSCFLSHADGCEVIFCFLCSPVMLLEYISVLTFLGPFFLARSTLLERVGLNSFFHQTFLRLNVKYVFYSTILFLVFSSASLITYMLDLCCLCCVSSIFSPICYLPSFPF